MKYNFAIACLLFSSSLLAAETFYCQANHSIIKLGMSQSEVLNACGVPLHKSESTQPAMQKIPVTQLFFNQAGSPTAFYGVWEIPVGTVSGANLEVDIIDNKVHAIRLNGSGANASTICDGEPINIGDPANVALNACGNPSQINHTFIYRPMIGNPKPEKWIYELDPYQKNMLHLTFIRGRLQSIDQLTLTDDETP